MSCDVRAGVDRPGVAMKQACEELTEQTGQQLRRRFSARNLASPDRPAVTTTGCDRNGGEPQFTYIAIRPGRA